jgi:predicted transcriptional regulator
VGISRQAERRPRGGLERQVLACLAAAGRSLTPREVLDELGGGLAYTTVMTTLSRLYDKGVLERHAAGRAYAYALADDPSAVQSIAVAQRMRRLLDAGGDRAAVLARFVSDLRPEDERLLAELLGDLQAEDDGPAEDGRSRRNVLPAPPSR